jgi:nicotinate-nucleotide--dimethylbenzimidazole phosphoribosyltransferase
VGAGPLPVDHRGRRPPIPIVPVDEAARARGADEQSRWLAGVTGDPSGAAPRVRTIDAADVDVLHTTLAARRDTPGMSVGEVALAVDAGRELAARASAAGIQVLVATAPSERDDTAARAVAAALTGGSEHGPLGVLRRLGDATTAVLCGVALGAGEQGLGCVCDGLAALAGAAVAAGIEPDLRPRLAAAQAPADGDAASLAAHLGLPPVAP